MGLLMGTSIGNMTFIFHNVSEASVAVIYKSNVRQNRQTTTDIVSICAFHGNNAIASLLANVTK